MADQNTILLYIILGLNIAMVYGLKRIFALERKIALLELAIAGKKKLIPKRLKRKKR